MNMIHLGKWMKHDFVFVVMLQLTLISSPFFQLIYKEHNSTAIRGVNEGA